MSSIARRAAASARHGAADGAIVAPMPGKVTAVEVSAGDKVTKGQRLLTLEAMKMEHGLTAPFDGVVAELSAEGRARRSSEGDGRLWLADRSQQGDEMKIDGIAAVVTGGASGLGEATARELAAKRRQGRGVRPRCRKGREGRGARSAASSARST